MKYLPNTVLIGLLTTSLAQAAPPAFEARYEVLAKGLDVGMLTTTLTYKADQYTYQKITKANGLAALLSGDTLTETSNGQKQDTRLIPRSYQQHHKNRRKDKQDMLTFSTPTRVQGRYEDQPYQLDVPDGTLDPALLELVLMDDLPAGKSLDYNVVSKGKVQAHRFRKLGKESVKVPAGNYTCEKIAVVHENGNQATTLWLAPQLNYALIKANHQENGEILETRLAQYQAR